jgi:hypothetical protein
MTISLFDILRFTIILSGWPILVAGSISIIITGGQISHMIGSSPVGKTVWTLVVSWLVAMYSLGAVATALLYYGNATIAISLVVPVFIAWLITFFWTMYRFLKTAYEIGGIGNGRTS